MSVTHGVDYDTNRVAVCTIDGTSVAFRTFEYREAKQDAFQAAREVGRALPSYAIAVPQGTWWVEHAFGMNRAVDFKLGRVQGAILAALPYHAAVNEVGPPEWKKGIGLPGNAGKAAYLPNLLERLSAYPVVEGFVPSEHELDAFGIALFGRRYEETA